MGRNRALAERPKIFHGFANRSKSSVGQISKIPISTYWVGRSALADNRQNSSPDFKVERFLLGRVGTQHWLTHTQKHTNILERVETQHWLTHAKLSTDVWSGRNIVVNTREPHLPQKKKQIYSNIYNKKMSTLWHRLTHKVSNIFLIYLLDSSLQKHFYIGLDPAEIKRLATQKLDHILFERMSVAASCHNYDSEKLSR